MLWNIMTNIYHPKSMHSCLSTPVENPPKTSILPNTNKWTRPNSPTGSYFVPPPNMRRLVASQSQAQNSWRRNVPVGSRPQGSSADAPLCCGGCSIINPTPSITIMSSQRPSTADAICYKFWVKI